MPPCKDGVNSGSLRIAGRPLAHDVVDSPLEALACAAASGRCDAPSGSRRYAVGALLAVENTFPIAILAAGVIVGGYVAVVALWWFVFRTSKEAERGDPPGPSDPKQSSH